MKQVCKVLNYIKHVVIICCQWLCFSLCFASLVDLPIGISSSAVGLNICPTTAGNTRYK